ncbi:hypothetical protein Enr10x_49160 [Gimesia panareensis]|uniref:Uncharacterized protein n=1 Tax=Gimesia panareensis TaxID=2527978 RepID=A0A517QD65_9PLAN|nr:hypothetical protein [Gimesia panareensis]QDT29561.1 hypothetical protein Enr10x_49160 [Gimesia panareensis]
MIDFELEQMLGNPEWCLVLKHYSVMKREMKDRDPEFDGWIIRQNEVAGVVPERLPRIHGKLIAFDLLKFQISGRDSGVFYQVTRTGEKMLPRMEEQLAAAAEDAAGDTTEEQPLARSA